MRYLLSEIAELCGGCLLGEDQSVESVVTDSRSVGCELSHAPLFVAMQGANHDSHLYVDQMVGRGIKAFMVEREVALPQGCGAIVVGHSIVALQHWAAAHRKAFCGQVVAIAGSNGKTVVKEWIAQTMPRTERFMRSPKSYNSQLGVALSLLLIEGDEQVALIEAGISQVGEMTLLEDIIRPDCVIFTNLGDAHQEFFETIEQKAEQKLILARSASVIIYDGEQQQQLAVMIESQYGDRKLLDVRKFAAQVATLFSEAPWRSNASLVLGFYEWMGLPAPSLAQISPVAMRLEVKDGISDSIIVNDAYNLDLSSLTLALDYLHAVALGRATTLFLSDVAQSGLSDDDLYGRVVQMVERAGVDRIVGVGPKLVRYADLFSCDKVFYLSMDGLLGALSNEDISSRAVLLKGAREWRFERISRRLERKSHTTILEVDLDAMTHNLNHFRAKLKRGVRLTAMVKARSYGAGDFEVAQLLQHQGVDYLAVAFADEGVILRERGITMPIVVLNADQDSFDLMVSYHLEPEIYSFNSLEAFACAASLQGEGAYPIHIKLDAGMHRLGFMESELSALVERLGQLKSVRVASIFAHFSCADIPDKEVFTQEQIVRYDAMSSQLIEGLGYAPLRHLANSAAIDQYPEAQFDMCRLGIGLYGYGAEGLRPVSTLRTRIVQIRELEAGQAVGYGQAGELTRRSRIATIPIGYADGLDRHLGCGKWSVLVGGVKAPIVGRICMDSCMIDVTDCILTLREGDPVVIFSPEPGNDAEAMAQVLGTICYEVLTSVSSRVKRVYLS